ncbi:MAG TPA: HlyD family efflux transporter periplasmic adaptor subunit [Kofleriaceae bacterium]|nr:HlyD family efflux transporter periplasmic adaptor subunit [Kofleriaceae bacterium]
MMSDWGDESTQIRALPFVGADRILVADGDLATRTWLREILAGHFVVEEVESGRHALERLATEPPRVLMVGAQLTDVSGAVLLTHAARHGLLSSHSGGPVTFALSDHTGASPEVDEQVVPIFFRLTQTLQPDRIRELLAQAIARLPHAEAKPPTEADAMRVRQVVEHAKRLAMQHDLKSSARTAIAAVVQLAGADRARCLYYDDETGALWSGLEDEDDLPLHAGIAAFAVRAKACVALPHAKHDPSYHQIVDDPAGGGDERIAVQPVADRDGRVHGVLIAIREAAHRPFGEDELRKLEALAEAWAPFIHQLAQAQAAEQVLEQHEDKNEVFRQEAIDHLVRRGQRGDVVRVHPGWVHAAYWLVVLFVLGAGGFIAFAQVHQYAEGPAVVRVTGRTDITALEGGTITALEVTPGQEVKEGQVLARLHDTEQAARLRAMNSEFERKLVAYLQSPADPAVRQSLASLVTEREKARAGVEARTFRAPRDGIVKEVHVANGQRIDAGKTILSIVDKGASEGMSVLAFLPGHERPRIKVGQQLRFTLPGYRGAKLALDVQAVSSEVIGGKDARDRYLGERFKESFPLDGSVVVVEGRLTHTTFEADNQTYELHDGMTGFAEVQLASKSMLETFLPGLR